MTHELHHRTSNNFVASRCTNTLFIDFVFNRLKTEIVTDQLPFLPVVGLLVDNPDVRFVKVGEEGKEPEGLGAFYGNEVHTLFLPSLRGARAIKAARKVMEWFWANTTYPAVTSFVYSHRPDVALFARLMGFEFLDSYDDGTTINEVPVQRSNLAILRPCLP